MGEGLKRAHEAAKRTRLKVIGGNYGGTHRAIMACYSKSEFKRATGISIDFCGETGNKEEISIAMAEPGEVFIQSYKNGAQWIRAIRKDGYISIKEVSTPPGKDAVQ